MSAEANKTAEAATPAAPSASQSPRALLGRLLAWAGVHRRRALLVAFACLLSLVGAVAAWLGLSGHGRKLDAPTLQPALAALDRGVYDEAHRLADAYQRAVPEDDTGGPDFVRGAAIARRVDASASDLKSNYFREAARLLTAARSRGFPHGRETEGLYLLGKSLYGSGQLTACRPVLREALKLNPRFDPELRYLLAEAYLADNPPNPALADEENRLAQDDRPPPEWLARLKVQHARILLAQGKSDESLEVLKALPPREAASGETLVVRGQILTMQARDLWARVKDPEARERARRKTEEAIDALRAAQGADTLATDVSRRAMYLVGMCLMDSGDTPGAIAEFQRARRIFAGTPEAAAATFAEAELLRAAGNPEAIELYLKTLRTLDPNSYSNSWLPLDALRRRLLGAFQGYSRSEDFAACAQLAAASYPLVSKPQAVELQAENQATWGRILLAKADAAGPDKADALRREGRMHLRLAGEDFATLAELVRVERRYTEDLWNSAQAYLAGRDYLRAGQMAEKYLQEESRRRQAEGLTLLGEALLAQGRLDEAVKRLDECVRLHPREAASFRARLLAAQAYVEKGDHGRAETLLRENLQADLLTPASTEWRESLFDLGTLLHDTGRYEAAVARLDEAAQRYPHSPRAATARWLAADCQRQRGLALKNALPSIIVESTRRDQTRQATHALEDALSRFRALRESLLHAQSSAALREPDALVLRNCEFAAGEVLAALGRDEEAARAYVQAVQQHPQSASSLEAYLEMARAYLRLGRAAEARGAAEQARLLLGRVKSDAALAATTSRDRKEWTETLDALTSNP